MWVRIVGTVGIILYGVLAIYVGLAQQRVGLATQQIDCAYRTKLLRDRVVALTQRSPHHTGGDAQEAIISTLLRETQAACATNDAEITRELDAVQTGLQTHLQARARETEARRELLAL